MASTKINGVEYEESNYPNCLWFWTWLHYKSKDSYAKNSPPFSYASGAGHIENFDVAKWEQFLRCPCGVGYTPATRIAARTGKPCPGANNSKADRWLCSCCGRTTDTLIIWIGRRDANRWTWKLESELPDDMKPKKKEVKNFEEDFDKRVKAAVEVEIALRMKAPQNETILG